MRPFSAEGIRARNAENATLLAKARKALAGTGLGSRNASTGNGSRSSGS